MEGKRALSMPLPEQSKKPRVEHSTYGLPMPLNLGCKIFLSHSGNDKEFVRFLHEKLCSRYQDNMVAFFDAETLPTAEAISMVNILEEARRSQLGVLVLTEAFFLQTPNPMLELEEFVASKVRLLPLFFGMSVKEFKKKKQSCSWEEHWRTNFAKELGGIRSVEEVIVRWRHALDLVPIFSGLEYKNMATNHLEYIHKIVNKVTSIIPPTSLFSENGVYGKERLCQIVDNMYEKCAVKYSGCTVLDVVGIHGFSGLGKTTLCKCLYNFYFTKFKGNVCYINIESSVTDQASPQKLSFSNRMRYVLSRLGMHTNNNFFDSQDTDQVKSWFKKKISSMKDPIFLAIDNVLSKKQCEEEVEFYLGCKFWKGSKIFITSRSESILTNLVSQHTNNVSAVIEYMPTLEFEAAKEIFLNELPSLGELENSRLEDGINECVNMCTIYKTRYHPLMLKSLAAFVKWNRLSKNIDWKGRLAKLCSEGITDKEDAWERVYDMFDMTYALLSNKAKRVFLDLVLFYSATQRSFKMYEWIEKVYSHLPKKKMAKIILQLEDLCLIEKNYMVCLILDLMIDYGKYKAGQGSKYVVLEDGAPGLDDSRRRVRTVSISRCGRHQMVDLRNMKGVKVLHITDNAGLQVVLLSHASIARLRSLIVRVPAGTSLIFYTIDEDWTSGMGSMSAGLRWVDLEGDVCFRSLRPSETRSLMSPSNVPFNSLREVKIASLQSVATDLVAVFGGLRNLEHLQLSNLPGVRSIDVTTCSNLKVLHLSSMPRLQFINVDFKNPKLENVDIWYCGKLLALTGIPAHSKAVFNIRALEKLETISFCTMSSQCAGALSSRTRPGYFSVEFCPALTNIERLSEYMGSFRLDESAIGIERPSRVCMTSMGEICGDSGLQLDAGFDLSIFSARIAELELTEYNSASARLACATRIDIEDAQHAGLLFSALFKAQPKDLEWLRVICKEVVDCGCNQNVPHFCPLPPLNPRTPERDSHFFYNCQQVKDLASLAQWHTLQHLHLCGCTRVEVWPDFAAMTSLETLDLSYTSLKEWPTGVLRLSHLNHFQIDSCRYLPAEELIKVAKFALQPATLGNDACIMGSLADLILDLESKTRDRCSVADALDVVYPEFVALFDRSNISLPLESYVQMAVLRIMYDVCFGEVGSEEEKLHIRTRMRSLLCSEIRFVAFSFHACSQDAWAEAWGQTHWSQDLDARVAVGLMGIPLVGGSIEWYGAPALNDDLRDSIIIFLKSFTQEVKTAFRPFKGAGKYSKVSERIENIFHAIQHLSWSDEEKELLRQRVGEGVCRMARVGSVAAELGETFMHTIIHDLEANLNLMSPAHRQIERVQTRRNIIGHRHPLIRILQTVSFLMKQSGVDTQLHL